ncbi:MAG: helix-turn-helix domain-containing protein, partial [Bacteroidales bacterium]|nr:helix-turn-helix domain-containing protein [Bacteroidales bacterium]
SVKDGYLDAAYPFLNKARQLAERLNPGLLPNMWHSLGSYYREKGNSDSAFFYYRLLLDNAEKGSSSALSLSSGLSGLGRLFFDLGKPDSAILYINRSNVVASQHDVPLILMDNYLLLSKIAESKGNSITTFEYFKQYTDLKESIFGRGSFFEISKLQHTYEVSKVNQQVEQLTIGQQIRDKIIRNLTTVQYVLLAVLILISTLLVLVFVQNKRLNAAYKKLFEKNVEITELRETSFETPLEKCRKSNLTDEKQNKLLSQIYALMEDTAVVCDKDLSLDKLAILLNSNSKYISLVLNDVLKKDFRTFVHEYRIREAQRLFSEDGASKYTVEGISSKTGFKSRNTFNKAFKEFIGVSPGFYLKSMQGE